MACNVNKGFWTLFIVCEKSVVLRMRKCGKKIFSYFFHFDLPYFLYDYKRITNLQRCIYELQFIVKKLKRKEVKKNLGRKSVNHRKGLQGNYCVKNSNIVFGL